MFLRVLTFSLLLLSAAPVKTEAAERKYVAYDENQKPITYVDLGTLQKEIKSKLPEEDSLQVQIQADSKKITLMIAWLVPQNMKDLEVENRNSEISNNNNTLVTTALKKAGDRRAFVMQCAPFVLVAQKDEKGNTQLVATTWKKQKLPKTKSVRN